MAMVVRRLRLRRSRLFGAVLLSLALACGACADGGEDPEDRGDGEGQGTAAREGGDGRGVEGRDGGGGQVAEGQEVDSPPPDIPSTTGLPGASYTVAFAADGSGITLRADCDEKGCTQYVGALAAGAPNWHRVKSPLPYLTEGRGMSAGVETLGPGRALITEESEQWSAPDRTWFTRDGGTTWKRGSSKPTGTTATVPKDAVLVGDCLELGPDGNDCLRNRLLVVLPDTGEHKVLDTGAIPLEGLLAPAGEVSPDALFVSGEDPRTGLTALAVTADRGRTWRFSHLPEPAKPGWPPRVVGGGSGLYAVQTGELPRHVEVKNGLVSVYRSTDAGRTWTRVWRHRPGIEPLSVLGDLVVADDNSLTLYGEDGSWRSTDQARTFHSTSTERGPAGAVERTPIGWLWSDSYGNGASRISADGVRWHDFFVGEE
ncbi:exo-alpha-sialidase [Streptomyces sp. NPDC088387]|uniref:exo-alpha-sialidase n=1 Tax=Streptomyces sp. NPDC088387 TaxID=3365859 RepID=UPI00382885CE